MMNRYLSIDRQLDAQVSLEAFIASVENVKQNELFWKFGIISIHCALQGFMTIALANGNSFNTWKKSQFKKWYEAYQQSTEGLELNSVPQLDFFMNLFDKTFSNISAVNRDNINWLNETRNNLIHFNTDSFGVDRASIYSCCNEAIKAIEITPSISQGIFFYEDEQKNKFEKIIKKSKEVIEPFLEYA